MDSEVLNQETSVFGNLIKQLSLAVRSIQWSYAIFWSISATQPGVLNWGCGYYNGDIKTRKTVKAVELNSDQVNSQRSDQLRELYEFLAAGDSSSQSRRASAALSPEDLTDSEWYYLVCMSFVYSIGQGLPGRTLASGQPIWLYNAHTADSKIFSRSLLAKSASIQTVVCFPFLGGVIELGVTDLVLEELSLIEYVKTSFLDIPHSSIPKKSNPIADYVLVSMDHILPVLDHNIPGSELEPVVQCEELKIVSIDHSIGGFCPSQTGDVFLVEDINVGASQMHSWSFIEEEFSNCVNSSHCISQTFAHPEKALPLPKIEPVNSQCSAEIKECIHTKLNSLDPMTDDRHYQGVISALLKSSDQLTLGPRFRYGKIESNFVKWIREDVRTNPKPSYAQRVLKKALIEIGRMHSTRLLKPRENVGKQDGVLRPEVETVEFNHKSVERKQKEELDERFLVLRSLVPTKSKVDEISILDETIQYLKQLEKKVEALESSKESSELEAMTGKTVDAVEQTSDNYGTYRSPNGKKPLINKRKASDMDEREPDISHSLSQDCSIDNVNVSIAGRNVKIELRCPWRECILLELVDAMTSLDGDSHSVQSSTKGGILSVTIKSKFKGLNIPSARMIRQALQRIIVK